MGWTKTGTLPSGGGGGGGAVASVNAKTGVVVLNPDDLDDASSTHKFVTAAEKTKLGNTTGTNTGDQDLSGLTPKTRTVNGHPLTSDVVVAADDITTGTLPTSVLPALAITDVFPVASQAAMLALTAQKGDVAVRADTGVTYILSTNSPSTLADWLVMPAIGKVQSVAGQQGVVVLSKSDVGLGSVDNTSDAGKPVSTAQAAALSGKEPAIAGGTTAQYLRGDKAWTDFATDADARVRAIEVPFDQNALQLTRIERQSNRFVDSSNLKVRARVLDASVFTELWDNTQAWFGSATVANRLMYNSPSALSKGISLPVGVGRYMVRGVLTLGASTHWGYLGVTSDAPGTTPNINNCVGIGINNTNVSGIIGANVTGTASNAVGGIKAAGDYIVTIVVDEDSIGFALQAKTNPGVTVHSFSILRSQMPGGAVNSIFISNNETSAGLLTWGPVQAISELSPPPVAQQTPNGVSLWGTANPIHFQRKNPGHQLVTITGAPTGGTFTLTYAGQTTSAMPYNVTGPAMKAALEALSTVGAGNASVNCGGTVYAVRLKGALGLVAMTKTSSLTGGSSPDVTITQSAVRWFHYIPGDYDARNPIPFTQFLHWSLTATGITPYIDARLTATLNNLVAAGYAFLSSDNGPATTNGATQDGFGNQYSVDEYAEQTRWFRQHFATSAEFLFGGSQGGTVVENILASRLTNALGNIAAVLSVSPARDLKTIVSNPTFTTLFQQAYGATSISDFQTKVNGYNPIDFTPAQVRAIPHKDYVAQNDPTTDPAVNTTAWMAALAGWAPESTVTTQAGSVTHLDSLLFVKVAADIVAYFDTYNTVDRSTTPTPVAKPPALRVRTQVSTATLTPDMDSYDMEILGLQAAGLTIAAPIGAPTDGQKFKLRITDNGTARALTWNAIYHGVGFTLPVTTVAGKPLIVAGEWNAALGRVDILAVAQDA